MHLSISVMAINCYNDYHTQASCWMKVFFEQVACHMPNGDLEIEQLDKTDVYYEYKKAVTTMSESEQEEYLSYTKFLELWANSYPKVKIKAYKQVILLNALIIIITLNNDVAL